MVVTNIKGVITSAGDIGQDAKSDSPTLQREIAREVTYQ